MIIRPLELLNPERAPLAAAMCSNLEKSLSRNTVPAQTDDLTPPPSGQNSGSPIFSPCPKSPTPASVS